MLLKNKTRKLIRTTSVAACSCFLVLAYLLGTLPVEVWHRIVHPYEQVLLHSASLEKDPCHRRIYHHDPVQGCHHKAHLTENKKCCFPAITITSAQLMPHYLVPAFQHAGTYYKLTDCSLLADTFLLYRSSRAPPVS